MLTYQYELKTNCSTYTSCGSRIFVKKENCELTGVWILSEYCDNGVRLREWKFMFEDCPMSHITWNNYKFPGLLSVIADHKQPVFEIIAKKVSDIFDIWYIKLDNTCLEVVFLETVKAIDNDTEKILEKSDIPHNSVEISEKNSNNSDFSNDTRLTLNELVINLDDRDYLDENIDKYWNKTTKSMSFRKDSLMI